MKKHASHTKRNIFTFSLLLVSCIATNSMASEETSLFLICNETYKQIRIDNFNPQTNDEE